jgi:hypothetical protein
MKIATENQTLTHQPTVTEEIRSGPALNVPDFSEVRHQILLENREIDDLQELLVGSVNHKRRRVSSLVSAARVEAALYCLVSAPALLYLIYLIARPLIGVTP